jgi:hypothetical protein
MSFAERLAVGKMAESKIARFMMNRGHIIMPAYEIEIQSGKGPQLFASTGETIAPDLLLFKKDGALWIEAKSKTVFAWNRVSSRWVTGIDLRHYKNYLTVMDKTGLPVWILFYHTSAKPSAHDVEYHCPVECPTGLFGRNLEYLRRHEHHRCPPLDIQRDGMKGHGRSGMVYWAAEQLQLIATMSVVESCQTNKE